MWTEVIWQSPSLVSRIQLTFPFPPFFQNKHMAEAEPAILAPDVEVVRWREKRSLHVWWCLTNPNWRGTHLLMHVPVERGTSPPLCHTEGQSGMCFTQRHPHRKSAKRQEESTWGEAWQEIPGDPPTRGQGDQAGLPLAQDKTLGWKSENQAAGDTIDCLHTTANHQYSF